MVRPPGYFRVWCFDFLEPAPQAVAALTCWVSFLPFWAVYSIVLVTGEVQRLRVLVM